MSSAWRGRVPASTLARVCRPPACSPGSRTAPSQAGGHSRKGRPQCVPAAHKAGCCPPRPPPPKLRLLGLTEVCRLWSLGPEAAWAKGAVLAPLCAFGIGPRGEASLQATRPAVGEASLGGAAGLSQVGSFWAQEHGALSGRCTGCPRPRPPVSPLTRKRPRGRGCHQGPGCLPPLSSGPPLGRVWKENTETWKTGSREMSVIPALRLPSHSRPWLSALPYGFSWARQSSSRPLPPLPVHPRGAEGSGPRRHRGGLPRVRAFTGAVGTSRVFTTLHTLLEALTTISSNSTVFHRR